MNKISNKMFGKLIVLDKKEKLLNGTIRVKREGYSQCNGNITIPLFEKSKAINGTLIVKKEKTNYLSGAININPKNSLYGIVDIINTPKRKFYGDLVKDSYTLKTYPENNFGMSRYLELTQDSTVFLGYDFDKNKDNFYLINNEQEAYLDIYITLAVQKSTKLKVFTTSNNWSEHFIIDSNKPAINNHVVVDIPINYFGWLKVPLGDLLKHNDKVNNTFQQSLAIQIEGDNTSTYSKDSLTILHPKLCYEYYVAPPSTRKILMGGQITVEQNSTRLLKGLINVDSKIVTKSIQGSIDIPVSSKTALIGGSITILKQPLPKFFLGNLEIPIFNKQATLNGNITVKAVNEKIIAGNLEVPVFENQKMFNGNIQVEQKNQGVLKGNIEVPIFNKCKMLSGQMTVMQTSTESILGSIEIPLFKKQSSIRGEIKVLKENSKTIKGLIEVPLFHKQDVINGAITVQKEKVTTIKGFIQIPLLEDKTIISGEIIVQKKDSKMISGEIKIPLLEEQRMMTGSIDIPLLEKQITISGFIEIPLFENQVVITGYIEVPLFKNEKSIIGSIFVDNEEFKTRVKQYSFIM